MLKREDGRYGFAAATAKLIVSEALKKASLSGKTINLPIRENDDDFTYAKISGISQSL